MPNLMTHLLPEKLKQSYRAEIQKSLDRKLIPRIWENDATVWTGTDEAKWLGWLTVVAEEMENLQVYRKLHSDIEAAGFTHTLLMGMGGSSLCPEVLAATFGIENFHIIDSTVPAQVISVESKLDLAGTLFIVASKSGSTLEPNCFYKYFFDRAGKASVDGNAGGRFIAITDPGSKMEQTARERGFRELVYGKPEIGGRFSALSAFGLTAAGAMGLDVERLLRSADVMVQACRSTNPTENPGAILGTLLGVCHREGRDKLTIFLPPEFYDLGAWLEQLIAESTGKNGMAIIPVDREGIQAVDHYGDDRVFVNFTVRGVAVEEDVQNDLSDIAEAGHPMINIEITDKYSIAQEFFRWEFATAVAGSLMGINPFDQPDVESAKIEARKITDSYEVSGQLPPEEPFYTEDAFALFSRADYAAELENAADERSLAGFLEAHLWNIAENDYFAILAFIEMDPDHEEILQQIRELVLEHYSVATCIGFGPRFLHSTGQAYKGGPNNGVFLQITCDDPVDVPVPGQKYSFGIVKAAQARGDFQVLLDRGRRALRVHISGDVHQGLERLLDLIG
ncbi:MAG TPA: bifunctional transaldolase/phosoglucose isomerase [Pyrinomonadaceae bacterium]|nr:bifunctional transaldolase/phosoglucose isomerase [Pyrinomonadaceae bacterium]